MSLRLQGARVCGEVPCSVDSDTPQPSLSLGGRPSGGSGGTGALLAGGQGQPRSEGQCTDTAGASGKRRAVLGLVPRFLFFFFFNSYWKVKIYIDEERQR